MTGSGAATMARRRAPTRTGRRLPGATAAATATFFVLAVLVGTHLGRLARVPVAAMLFAAPVTVIGAYLLAKRATWSVVALIGMTIAGLSKYGTRVAGFDLRLPDVAYVALVLWVLKLRAEEPDRPRGALGQRQMVVFLVALGASLLPVFVLHRSDFMFSFVGWARLVQTASLFWLVPRVVRSAKDHHTILCAIMFFGSVEIVRATLAAVILHGGIADRLAGANNPNGTGLIAAVILLLAVHAPVPEHRTLRIVVGACGVLGLLLTRSNGSVAAAAMAFAVFGLVPVGRRRPVAKASYTSPARVLFLAIGLFAAIVSLRPESLPGTQRFNSGSTAQRAILATAGLDLFVHNPLIGVGWQRAPRPSVIGDPKLSDRLRQQFSQVTSKEFFPDQGPTNVHNAYIEVLAETGLVGFLALIAVAIAVVRSARRTTARALADPDYSSLAPVYPVLAFAVLVWWNDNALFGAQVETVFLFVFLGLLAAVASSAVRGARPASPGPAVVER